MSVETGGIVDEIQRISDGGDLKDCAERATQLVEILRAARDGLVKLEKTQDEIELQNSYSRMIADLSQEVTYSVDAKFKGLVVWHGANRYLLRWGAEGSVCLVMKSGRYTVADLDFLARVASKVEDEVFGGKYTVDIQFEVFHEI